MDKLRVLTISPKSTFLKTIKGILKSPASKNKSWPKLQIDHFPSFSEKIPGESLELVRIAFVDFDSLSLTSFPLPRVLSPVNTRFPNQRAQLSPELIG